MFFTLVCTLPAAGAVPAALAQEDTWVDEDLARSIISDVLDSAGEGSSTASSSVLNEAIVELNQEANENNQQNFNEFGDDDATQVQVGMQDQDQRTANLAAQLGLRSWFDFATYSLWPANTRISNRIYTK